MGRREEELVKVALRQFGIVTARQVLDAGVTLDAAGRRVDRGIWKRLHRGIFKCGAGPTTLEEREFAALLAAGEGAALSHFSAAVKWQLPVTARTEVHLCLPPARRVMPLEGVILHRTELKRGDVVKLSRFDVTSLNRTIIDLAPHLNEVELRSVIDARRRKRNCPDTVLDDLLSAGATRKGATNLKGAIATYEKLGGKGDSALESLAAMVFIQMDPPPLQNYLVCEAGRTIGEVDLAWPDAKIVVETDGHAYHSSPREFERDRVKQNALHAAGWLVFRFTWKQLTTQPELCLRQVQEAYEKRTQWKRT